MQARLHLSKHLYDLDLQSKSEANIPRNRFESLLKQTIQDDTEPGPFRSTKSPGPFIKDKGTTSGQKYHMEVKDSQESAFMVFTLFAELQDIKTKVKHLWKRCFKDAADMVVATVLTAQALAFVQRSEERIISVLDDARCQGVVAEQEDICKGAWSFAGTYCRLLSTLRDPTDVEAVLRFEDSRHISGTNGDAVSMNDLTFTFSARRLGYFTRPIERLFCTPLLTEFEHNPLALLNADIYKITERDRSLCCTLVELMKRNYILPPQQQNSEEQRRFESARKDPILGSLHPVWTRKEVNLTGVFAAEIMLDIKEICDAFPASRPSFYRTYDSYMDLLGLKVDKEVGSEPVLSPLQDSPLVRGAGTDGWESKVLGIMTKVSCMFSEPITSANGRAKTLDTVPAHTADDTDSKTDIYWQQKFDYTDKESLDIYKGLDPLALKYSTEEYQRSRLLKFIVLGTSVSYLFDNYPMFTTVREAFMQTLIESAGIEILNADKYGIGAMAHIYNASRQLGLGNLRWPAMDRLIDIHKVALFAGDVPTTPAAMLRSFSHRLWGPKGRLSPREKKRRLNRAVTMMKPSAMTQAYNEHWDTAGRIPFWYTLESNALAAAAKKAGKKTTSSLNFSFVENIPVIEEYLTKELQDVRVNYMEIDKVGVDFNNDLLKHAREKFTKQTNRVLQSEAKDQWSGIDFASESFEQEAQLHEAMPKYGGDPSKLPIQDCDYLQDSINCLTNALKAKGIGGDVDESVNMPTSLTRFRIRGSDDLPDMSRLVLVSHCSCCHRKYYF